MNKISVAGLKIDALTKPELMGEIGQRLDRHQKIFLTTPYSEFLYAALRDRRVMEILNRADLAVADGIGLLWAAKYLSLPLTAKSFSGKVIQAFWQMKWTLAAIVFYPRAIRQIIPEKIVGADLFFDLAQMARGRGQSVYLLGGYRDTPQRVAKILREKFPGLHVVGASNKDSDDASVLADLAAAKPDFLFVAYGPIKQEKWIAEHWNELDVRLAVGLGGTFDYVAGVRSAPPKFIRAIGLEWLFRLITQPQRAGRIFNATFGLLRAMLRFKVYDACPYRANVVCAVFNRQGKILICRRKPGNPDDRLVGETSRKKFTNYWQLPQGGVDPKEDLSQAALREAAEETGLTDLKVIFMSDKISQYEYPQALRPIWFNNRHFKGQRQNIMYLRHDGPDDAVKIDNFEFMDYQWVEPSQLAGIVHPERSPVTEIILSDLPKVLVK